MPMFLFYGIQYFGNLSICSNNFVQQKDKHDYGDPFK